MLSHIAESSRSVKGVTDKVKAFHAVKAIAEHLTDEQRRELFGELARLYAHFIPAIPKKPRNNFEWVSKAIPKKDTRHYLLFVHVTEDRIAATDGHRVHVAPNTDGLEPGYYDKAGTKLHGPKYAVYPDIDRVFPQSGTGRRIVESKLSDIQMDSFSTERTMFHYYRFPLNGDNFCAFNAPYLNDIVSMDSADTVHEWDVGDSNAVLTVKLSGGRKACVMPMRV